MLLIVSIILLSILALLPDADVDHDAGYTASELSIRETVDGSVISTSHVNPDGVITDAIDLGYATVCRMQDDDGRVVEERYLDANGYPVARYENFHGLPYEYDETSTVITYLDVEGNPIIRSDGYSTIVRTQVDGRAYDDFFYDLNGQQVQCSGGYYGLRRGYNAEGQDISLAFLDKDGHAVCTSSGYAIMTYQRDMNGNVVGKQYFDTDGNPKALSKGQYGIKRSGKANILLDRNGNVMPCVDNLLNGFPCMVVVLGCVVCLLMIALPKSLSVVLTIVYVAFILYETLMFRESGEARMNFVLFSYAGKFLKEQSVRVGVINNIWLFIPLGTGLYRWFQKKWVLLIPFVMSVAIETTQYITGLGIAEFDDVFGNTMGGWIGILVAYIIMMWRSEMVNHHLPRRPIL
ncbi:VanZ family protein [Faecalibacterium prausnitzii]|uniref:VanZ family protein n=1 Tax=Faecalibacterium prausnitzii TaxID=853 RepID=UPI0022E00E37|nr:VanZ family protein [Faecalibacterium prausnitzii]